MQSLHSAGKLNESPMFLSNPKVSEEESCDMSKIVASCHFFARLQAEITLAARKLLLKPISPAPSID